MASLYFVGIILFFFTLGLNILGNRFVRRAPGLLRERWH